MARGGTQAYKAWRWGRGDRRAAKKSKGQSALELYLSEIYYGSLYLSEIYYR